MVYCDFLAKLREVFHVQYSCKESPLRQVEEATYINFVDFVDKCEGIYMHTKQHALLIFHKLILQMEMLVVM